MSDLKKILEDNGKEAVQLYRQSLRDNDRVATGDTNQSIRYEVKQTNKTTTTLTLYALDHIRFLETGMDANDIKAENPMFSQIARWANAKNIPSAYHQSIYDGLFESGWSIYGQYRQPPKGGTPDLITSVDETVENNILNDIKQSSKSIVLQEIRTFKQK